MTDRERKDEKKELVFFEEEEKKKKRIRNMNISIKRLKRETERGFSASFKGRFFCFRFFGGYMVLL